MISSDQFRNFGNKKKVVIFLRQCLQTMPLHICFGLVFYFVALISIGFYTGRKDENLKLPSLPSCLFAYNTTSYVPLSFLFTIQDAATYYTICI